MTRYLFDAQRIADDMAVKGWHKKRLAHEAGVSEMTVIRFLRAEVQTPQTAKKLADALGYPIERYLVGPAPDTEGAVA